MKSLDTIFHLLAFITFMFGAIIAFCKYDISEGLFCIAGMTWVVSSHLRANV